jgi:transposase
MDDVTDTRQISRLEIVDTGRRRRWSAAEKLRIVEESFSGPRLASATARRHGISNQLLFAWRKAYREGQLGDIRGFVPAMIVAEQPEKGQRTWLWSNRDCERERSARYCRLRHRCGDPAADHAWA